MKIKGIIITGTLDAGKRTILERLVKHYPEYIYLQGKSVQNSADENQDAFLLTEIDNRKIVYTRDSIVKVQENGKIPAVIISPKTFAEKIQTDKSFFDGFLSFYIDACDEEIEERLRKEGIVAPEQERFIRATERSTYSDFPNYILQNKCVEKSVKIINRLVELYLTSTVLSENDITLYKDNGLLISDADDTQIKGASYDLRLGDEYYYRGEIKKLEKNNLRLTIAPYDYAIVSSKETICLPKDVVAHFGLTVGLFCQGIILSNGQQVDPGFRGTLFCLLFNTSNQPVTIKRGTHYATIEFSKMDNFASKYKGKYQEKKDIIDVLPANTMQGGLSELKQEVEELKNESHSLQQIYIGVISLIIAAISILLILK